MHCCQIGASLGPAIECADNGPGDQGHKGKHRRLQYQRPVIITAAICFTQPGLRQVMGHRNQNECSYMIEVRVPSIGTLLWEFPDKGPERGDKQAHILHRSHDDAIIICLSAGVAPNMRT